MFSTNPGVADHCGSAPLTSAVVFGPEADWQRAPSVATKNILHVINGEHFSGAERVQQLLGKRLDPLGFSARFACVKPGRFRECCQLREYQIIDVPMQGRFDFKVVHQLAELVRDQSICLLHAHTPRTAMLTSLVARRTRTPWVYHVHSPTCRDSTRGWVNRVNAFIERISIRQCNLLITVSRSLRREMLRLGVPRSKLAVVANGVPAIEPINIAQRMATRKWQLGMVALMRPRKGVEIALQAMQAIKQARLPVELELIGSFETKDYEQQILGMIQSLQIQSHVKLSGFTNEVAPAIRRLDAMLLPSLFGEGMPMVVLEAIAAGVPVIATDVEGTPEVIRDGVEGYLAVPHDAPSLAENIKLLTSSRENWAVLSRNALERHRGSFSDTLMAQKVARAYIRILNGS